MLLLFGRRTVRTLRAAVRENGPQAREAAAAEAAETESEQ